MMKINLSFICVAFFIVSDIIFDKNDVVDASEDSGKWFGPWERKTPKHDDSCSDLDQPCKCHSSCCLGYCSKGNTCVCTNRHDKCEGNKECCTGKCVNHATLGKVCECSEISKKCTSNNNCCEGFCDSKFKICKCIFEKGKCKSDKECCRGQCNKNRECVCTINGDACKVNKDCCVGFCGNGKCITCVKLSESGCTIDSDCCEGKCKNGMCTPSCGATDDSCGTDSDCCAGTCVNNKCNCKKKLDACVTDKECCGLKCVNIAEGVTICHCSEIPAACTVNDDSTCCEGFCDSKSGKCQCIDETGNCKSDKECCRGRCNENGKCVCIVDGATCKVHKECCGSFCENEKCRTCISDLETTCHSDSDCCRGTCHSDGFCQCGTLRSHCNIDSDCCGGTCVNNACNCVTHSGHQLVYCDPSLEDVCCVGTCRLDNLDNYQCLDTLLNGRCNTYSDCETEICRNGRCSCNGEGGKCPYTPLQCCEGLTCNIDSKICQK